MNGCREVAGRGRIFVVDGPELAACFERAAELSRSLECDLAERPDRPVLVGLSADIEPDTGWSLILSFEVGP